MSRPKEVELDVEADFEVLPVVSFKDEILENLRRSQIVICIGETGSGKTTQIPQFLVDSGFAGKKLVGVTQPRRIAAITVAQRVSNERKVTLGKQVGYTVRFDDCTSERTEIKFMTDGILIRECLSDALLSQYSVVMLDEAHERSLNTDILFGLMKKVLHKRRDLRVLVTSATLDAERFGKFFNNCPIIQVPGRIFPVDIYHSKTKQVMTAAGPASRAYVDAVVDVVLKIHRKEGEGHILVFLTGQEEIERACALIRQATHDSNDPDKELIVLPLYSALTSEAQADVFKKPSALVKAPRGGGRGEKEKGTGDKWWRKCVVATNIAETSITVPQVRFVVDAGYVKQKVFDPSRGIESLVVVPISKIAALQRAGRAGRTGPGQCYRLYSVDCFDSMPDESVPEIQRTNLANTVLYLKALGIEDVLSFDFLDPPSVAQLLQALTQLHTLGALTARGEISGLGRLMSHFPLDPNLSRVLMEAATRECDCVEEAVEVAAALCVENIWMFPRRDRGGQQDKGSQPHSSRIELKQENKFHRQIQRQRDQQGSERELSPEQQQAQLAHAALRHPYGDFLSNRNVLRAFEKSGYSMKWCQSNFVSFRALKTAVSIKDHLLGDVDKLHIRDKVRQLSRDSWPTTPQEDLNPPQERGSSKKREKHPKKERDPREYYSVDKRLCDALTAGFFMNAAVRCSNESVYKTLPLLPPKEHQEHKDALASTRLVHIHPQSAFSLTSPPEYVIYQELVHSAKLYIRQVGRTNPKCLAKHQQHWRYVKPNALRGIATSAAHPAPGGKTEQQEGGRKRPREEDSKCAGEPALAAIPRGVSSEMPVVAVDSARARYLARKAASSTVN